MHLRSAYGRADSFIERTRHGGFGALLLALLASCLMLPGCTARSSATLQHPAAIPSGLVIADVTVVSPERATPLEHAYVRILDGQIAEVSESPLRGEREIAGAGRYLIPGLIDSHVHLAVAPGFPSAMTADQARAHPGVVAATLAQDPRSYLYYGFTTVVDLAGSADRIARWNAYALRPDAHFCGGVAIIEGKLQPIRYPRFSYDVPLAERMPPVEPGQATAENIVGRIAAEGAICVKTVHDTGIEPTVEEGRALVAAAHARNLPVFIHANRKRHQAYAVAIGVDVIAHGMWRDPGEDAALDEEAKDVLAAIARDRIGYQPTTQVIAGLLDAARPDYLARAELAHVYPPALIELYANEGAAGVPDWIRSFDAAAQDRTRGTVGRAYAVTKVLAEGNARLLFGSDTPSEQIYTNPAGLNGRLEMDHWIAGGVSEAQLFRALTLENARMLRLDEEIGTIEPRKTANLLLLGANPLETVEAYDRIETVFLHGRPVARENLSARSANVAE